MNMDQVEGRNSRDSDQKLVKNTVFPFKTFISEKSTVWEWNVWVLRIQMENSTKVKAKVDMLLEHRIC